MYTVYCGVYTVYRILWCAYCIVYTKHKEAWMVTQFKLSDAGTYS